MHLSTTQPFFVAKTICLLTFGTGLPTRPSTEDGRQNTPETMFWLDYCCSTVVLNMQFLVIKKEANLGKGQIGLVLALGGSIFKG